MRKTALSLFPVCFLLLLAGCAEESNIQDQFAGLWTLETRMLPGGETLKPPRISGQFQWFLMDEKRGHVTVALSSGEDKLQLLGAVYTLEPGGFSREVYLKVGGGIEPEERPGYEVPVSTDKGQVALADGQAVITHADGTSLTFKGKLLTITHKDGTVDTWKKSG